MHMNTCPQHVQTCTVQQYTICMVVHTGDNIHRRDVHFDVERQPCFFNIRRQTWRATFRSTVNEKYHIHSKQQRGVWRMALGALKKHQASR